MPDGVAEIGNGIRDGVVQPRGHGARSRSAGTPQRSGAVREMTPVATTFFFYFLAALSVGSARGVILRKNAVHSAIFLVFTLLAQAGLYLMLYAPFVAGVQIILYAGGIMVLFLFVIMLISLERAEKERQFNKQWLVGIVAAAALGGLLIAVYTTTSKGKALFPQGQMTYGETQNTQAVASLLFDRYAGQYMF